MQSTVKKVVYNQEHTSTKQELLHTLVSLVGESSSRNVEELSGELQVNPSSANSSPTGQRHTALSPGASTHM